MIGYLFLVPVAYLLGSVPFGLIAGKLAKNVDIREHGSGSTGMTNVQRTVGTPAAALVLFLDMGKAALAVVVARVLFDSPGVEAASALAVVFGHNWSIFIRFQGGRGTASGWGGLIALSPIAGLVAALVGVPLIALTRYVSLGSISAAVLGSLALIVLAALGHVPLAYIWYGAIGSVVVVVRHRDNIQRLIHGTERKLGQRVEAAS
ncbi:MAG: glycerol-3-phosphate 1-O-acyltransferase PlsY [Chloroflexi bacterium]|nr:glycerol-3-phosphate 1-O-acyltransferase PlsY [Chloroflexota bacterium]